MIGNRGLRLGSSGRVLVAEGNQENYDVEAGLGDGGIKIHPLTTRLADPEVLKKMGASRVSYV